MTQVRCRYCGNSFAVQHTRKPPLQANTVWAPAPTPRWLFVLPLAFAMSIVGFSLWRFGVIGTAGGGSGSGGSSSGGIGNSTSGPVSIAWSPGGEWLQWDATEPFVVADVDDDAVEDVIGRYRVLEGDDLTLWVGAFSGADFQRMWRAGPFGTLSTGGGQAVHLTVAGDRVLVTDEHNIAHLLEPATGKQTARLRLPDRAERVCGRDGRFFVATVDGGGLLVDGSGKTEKAKPPTWCAGRGSPADDCFSLRVRRNVASECRGPQAAPSHGGFNAAWVLVDGDRAIAIGHKHPGTPVPMLMGFSLGRRRADWVRTLGSDPTAVAEGAPEVTELVGGRVFSYYGIKPFGGRVATLDAKTGEVAWDVVLPRSETGSEPSMLTATARRVYVPHWTWLDIFDARSGAHLGTIGRWR